MLPDGSLDGRVSERSAAAIGRPHASHRAGARLADKHRVAKTNRNPDFLGHPSPCRALGKGTEAVAQLPSLPLHAGVFLVLFHKIQVLDIGKVFGGSSEPLTGATAFFDP